MADAPTVQNGTDGRPHLTLVPPPPPPPTRHEVRDELLHLVDELIENNAKMRATNARMLATLRGGGS